MEKDEARQKAAEWLVELKTSDNVDVLWPAFHAWLQEDPENHSQYLELEKVWRISERALAPFDRCRSDAAARFAREVRAAAARRKLKRRSAKGAGLAFGAAVVIGIAFTLMMPTLEDWFAWKRYETAYGEHRSVPLSDGSVIDLNTNSCVWVRVTFHTRVVSLERGEALFTVAHDEMHPFKVNVDTDVLTAKGTQFLVRREPGGLIKTLVLNGRVEVPNHDVLEGSNEHAAASQPVIADAGFAVVITPTHTAVSKLGPSAVRARIAWTEGKIIVDGTLAEAVEELNRYNRRQLEIADPVYANRHIQGIFKTTDPDAFAETVQNALNISATYTGSAAEKTGFIRLGAMR